MIEKRNAVHLLKGWGLDTCNITDEPRGRVLNERSQTQMDEDRVPRAGKCTEPGGHKKLPGAGVRE